MAMNYASDGGHGKSEIHSGNWAAIRLRHRPASPSRTESPGVSPGHWPLAQKRWGRVKY